MTYCNWPVCLLLCTCILKSIGGFAQAPPQWNPTYFQQEVHYDIQVRLDDQQHMLHGFETLNYVNHAPEPLTELYIHLWPNAYRNNETAFARQQLENGHLSFYFATARQRGYIDSLDFRVDGEPVAWNIWRNEIDVARLELPRPLMPGDSLVLTTPFRVKIPADFSRFGHVGQQYQITQWYPKPAVYDNRGWHPMPYFDQGEFYSEFGTYDVTIEVPRNYVVAATGDLVDNPGEEAWLAEREAQSRNMLKAYTGDKDQVFEETFPPEAYKKLRFQQSHVHDFAWFCDKQYYVLTDSVRLPGSERWVRTVAMFNDNERETWRDATQYIKAAIYGYSELVGEYPYRHATAVHGSLRAGGGMEYPNVTVISAGDTPEELKRILIHEVGHNWFYGIFGFNERDHPWLDEGFNSYYEHRTINWPSLFEDSLETPAPGQTSQEQLRKRHRAAQQEEKGISWLPLRITDHGIEMRTVKSDPMRFYRLGYKYVQSTNRQQAIGEYADMYSELNYGMIVYVKATFALQYLESYLGTAVFDRCMRAFYERWKFRHPYPEDVQTVFEDISGQELDWFFEGLVQTTEIADFSVRQVERIGDDLAVTVRNGIPVPMPVHVVVYDADDQIVASQWTPPIMGDAVLRLEDLDAWARMEVNPGEILPERHIHNNVYENRSCLPRQAKPRLKFLYSLENNRVRPLYLAPMFGWNSTDGFMLGGLFYYQPYPKKNLEFHLLPMYGAGSQQLVGSAGITYRLFPRRYVRKIEFQSRTALFADLLRTQNAVEVHLFAPMARMKMRNVIRVRTHHLAHRQIDGLDFEAEQDYRPYYTALDWHFRFDRTLYEVGLDFELGYHTQDVIRTSISPYLRFFYTREAQARIRVFAGEFLRGDNVPYALQYRLNGSFDPFGQAIYLDRNGNSDWLDHQIIEDQGGFRSLLLSQRENGRIPSSSDWIFALNFDMQLPPHWLNFVHLFGNYGGLSPLPGETEWYYDAGVTFSLFGNMLRLHFPITGSAYRGNLPENWREFRDNITFSISVDQFIRRMDF